KTDKKAELEKRRQLRIKKARKKLALYLAVAFAVLFVMLLRYVHIYDLHNSIKLKTNELEEITMANEQTKLDIENMTDKSKIESYAENELGLKKATGAQIVYLTPIKENYMENISKSNSKSNGIKKFFAAFFEYFK
ncbi:MAG: hypothetical protein IJQ50_00370, partial [Clostridia bacterium]|nr:hypothetical protein [Clostridia bacterium]